MKYHIIAFGCQMNKADSERIASVLENQGYQAATHQDWREADLIVVNMCSVRQSAVDRVYGLIPKFKKLKDQNSRLKTILTGCVLEKDKKSFLKGFDQILKFEDLFNYQPKYQNDFRAYLPISNGCNWNCTYCVIPQTRGKLVCRDHQEILKEAKEAIEKGVKEIWLLGQNVNTYYSPSDYSINFAKLLKMINDLPGKFWLRFTSPNPKNFTLELIETMEGCQKFAKYLNLPVQSGDNQILKKMGRPYTAEEYKTLVKKIREKMPEISLSTDIIVGFPGETEENFQKTLKLLKEIEYDMAYIAQYSSRPGTKAEKMENEVPTKEKERRWKILNEILKKTSLKKNKKYLGKEVEVLFEEEKDGFYLGKTETYKTVKIKWRPRNLIGEFAIVKITKADSFGLEGELI